MFQSLGPRVVPIATLRPNALVALVSGRGEASPRRADGLVNEIASHIGRHYLEPARPAPMLGRRSLADVLVELRTAAASNARSF